MQYHVAVVNNSFRLLVRDSVADAMKDAAAFAKQQVKIVGLTREQALRLREADLRTIRS